MESFTDKKKCIDRLLRAFMLVGARISQARSSSKCIVMWGAVVLLYSFAWHHLSLNSEIVGNSTSRVDVKNSGRRIQEPYPAQKADHQNGVRTVRTPFWWSASWAGIRRQNRGPFLFSKLHQCLFFFSFTVLVFFTSAAGP